MRKIFPVLCLLLLIVGKANGGDVFTAGEATLLGVTQGATEFLPISSTAHLLLVDGLLSKSDGDKLPSSEDRELRRRAKNSYFSIIQVGSIFAVLCLYRRRFASMARGVFSRDRRGRRLLWNLLLSFFPAACVGFFIDGWLQKTLYGKIPIAIALLVGAAIMLTVEGSGTKRRLVRRQHMTIDTMAAGDSISIGLWQCLAFVPGMSRSMATIVGGYRCGLRRSDAAEYSFLLGVVTLTAAMAYKLVKDFSAIALCFTAKTFCLGIFAAFIASLVAIRFLIAHIIHHGIGAFAWYRVLLAALILITALS